MPGRPNNHLFSRRTDYGDEKTITVTQIRSGTGNKPKAIGTLRALGLGRIGKKNVLPDRPEIRGMLARVPHLIEVTSDDDSTSSGSSSSSARPSSSVEAVQPVAASVVKATRDSAAKVPRTE